jgi:hypothetical protein
MASAAAKITLGAGAVTFVNEWYTTEKIDFKVLIATPLAALLMEGLAKLDDTAATLLSLMVLMGAFGTEFNGKNVFDTLENLTSKSTTALAKSNLKIPSFTGLPVPTSVRPPKETST